MKLTEVMPILYAVFTLAYLGISIVLVTKLDRNIKEMMDLYAEHNYPKVYLQRLKKNNTAIIITLILLAVLYGAVFLGIIQSK